MAIDIKQLNKYVVTPVLEFLDIKTDKNSNSARNLILGTAAKESSCGEYLHQLNGGIASGIYQQEPASFDNMIKWYKKNNITLLEKASELLITNAIDDYEELHGNLYWATAVCRLYYYAVKFPLPHENNIDAIANYWKTHYNTTKGKGTIEEFTKQYYKFGIDKI